VPTPWKVTYTLTSPVVIAGAPIGGYPGLGVAFTYTADQRLQSIEHQLELADADGAEDARTASRDGVDFLISALEFTYGLPMSFRVNCVKIARATASVGTGTAHGFATVSGDAVIVLPLRFPSEKAIARNDPRLSIWLELVMRARASKDHGQAIRDYYMVIEDHCAGPPPMGDMNSLRLLRNFVSHPQIGDKSVIAFVNAELGLAPSGSLPPYQPSDPLQQAMLQNWRHKAEAIVKSLIDAKLP